MSGWWDLRWSKLYLSQHPLYERTQILPTVLRFPGFERQILTRSRLKCSKANLFPAKMHKQGFLMYCLGEKVCRVNCVGGLAQIVSRSNLIWSLRWKLRVCVPETHVWTGCVVHAGLEEPPFRHLLEVIYETAAGPHLQDPRWRTERVGRAAQGGDREQSVRV